VRIVPDQWNAPPVTEQAKLRIDPIIHFMISLLEDSGHASFLDFAKSIRPKLLKVVSELE
jgi:hypothetical protein